MIKINVLYKPTGEPEAAKKSAGGEAADAAKKSASGKVAS